MATLSAAKAKLSGDWENYDDLPTDRLEPMWLIIQSDCQLTNPELLALKEGRCKPQGSGAAVHGGNSVVDEAAVTPIDTESKPLYSGGEVVVVAPNEPPPSYFDNKFDDKLTVVTPVDTQTKPLYFGDEPAVVTPGAQKKALDPPSTSDWLRCHLFDNLSLLLSCVRHSLWRNDYELPAFG